MMCNMQDDNPMIVKSHDILVDSSYSDWLLDIKSRYRGTQIKAAVKVNTEQLLFNWLLGKDLVLRKAEERWGSGIVEQLSLDLRNEFPKAKGFSVTNLWYMKRWYLFYAKGDINLVQSLIYKLEKSIDMSSVKLHQVGEEIDSSKTHQIGGEIAFPPLFGFVPWRHHVEIITKCTDVKEALFYVGKTIEESWSRRQLEDSIEARLYHHSGQAITNFRNVFNPVQGKLAQEITKDNYDLGFISLPPEYKEGKLEEALEQNITRFLLELGTGFAFIGRQKEIIVSGKSKKIDMLFYHIKLKCYVVVELKVSAFEPEFAGKLNFYVNAVNELIKTPAENPTIGLLICRHADQTEVQWSFQGIQTPIGVSTYSNVQIENIKRQLPTIEQIQGRLKIAEQEMRLINNKVQTDIQTDIGDSLSLLSAKIVDLVMSKPAFTIKEIANALRVTTRTVEREMKKLQDAQRIKRVGGRRFGRWEVRRMN